MKKLYIYTIVCVAALLTSCAEENFEFVAQDAALPVNVSSVYPVSGTITRAGQSIVCLPARIIIQLEGGAPAPDGPDIVIG